MIDIHAHVTDDLDRRLTADAELGIELTVLASTRVHPERTGTTAEVQAEFGRLQQVVAGDPAAGSFQAAAAELAGAVEAWPARTRALAAAPLWLPPAELADVVEAQLRQPGYVGIGELTPSPDGADAIAPVLALAADHGGIPVLVHGFWPNTAADLAGYAALAKRYRTVPLIVGAFGGLHAMLAVELACAQPNLYLDLSSALQAFVVAAAIRELPERCLFGSNTPYGVPAAALATVEAAASGAGSAVRRAVLHDNAAALFRLS
ncbi:amidohydrolase family protein [Nakamurella aerolata]|uniref:Amidohydrolase family protein n=1 Tax=Nakamurella aerolata TaxID=1656892 RepID=A0A849A5L7_9ACTN|nr:amidohydrolase family protein [Nakamurella aerolata]